MSIDFDSAALQTQHDDEEEYDQEDYAREQEVKDTLLQLYKVVGNNCLCTVCRVTCLCDFVKGTLIA